LSTVARIADCRLSGSVTSVRIAIASLPARCAVSSPAGASISAIATLAPSRANRMAVARPIPVPAPVMKAILPASRAIDPSSPITDAKTADRRRFGLRYRSALRAEETAMTHMRPFDPALFGEAAIDAETAKLNAQMIQLLADQPDWWIIGAEAFRAARRRGEGPFPAPVMSSRARTLTHHG
jgi:hypothetical protein